MATGFSLNALDPRSFSDLERLAREDNSPEALRAAAQQFEAVFMQMVFKAMRDAAPQGGILDNEQTRMFQQLHDQQLSMELAQSGRGVGLAEALFRQLGGERAGPTQPEPVEGPDGQRYFDLSNIRRRPALSAGRQADTEKLAADAVAAGETARPAAAADSAQGPTGTTSDSTASLTSRVTGFVRNVWDHAVEAGRALDVPPQFVVAQAALETGWGRGELRHADGRSSHNLFNIKAGSSWNGPTVELPVTEYANGRAYTEVARFRSYDSYADAFRDYARLLSDSPRYADVLGQSDAHGFAHALQRGGYATDPHYADKIASIAGGARLRDALSSMHGTLSSLSGDVLSALR